MTAAWIGAGFVLAGAGGLGYSICRERREHTQQLKCLERAFGMIAGEIGYSRISLPEVLLQTAEKMSDDQRLSEHFAEISQRLCDGSGQNINTIWQEEMSRYLETSCLDREEKALIISFPESVWYLDGKRQQDAIAEFSARMGHAAQQAVKKEQEENRVTMMVSLTFGIFTALLLL